MSEELLASAFLTLLGGAIFYAFQKILDRREAVRARHFQIHMEMVEAICELANALNSNGEGKNEALSNYAKAKMKFAVVASDSSMKHFVAFDRKLSSSERVTSVEFDKLLAKYLRSARLENIGKTQVSDEDLVIVTPFGRSIRDK